ncbi:MAG: flagellar biosynthetic protein FliO [Anaeromicrobium sp.]|uniref:flagellar biosynthetic protein FliO n=1 Tax=Anaeromicrobium sp. TaxID=1929132 RepID=UPI0025CFF46E|nr:flagellar biosynthetic protein FliO [Anaeromicrobium sp.]MCT4595593.1 flagellar biosynthetic protein FliO [Anaeromicrobium sp.]
MVTNLLVSKSNKFIGRGPFKIIYKFNLGVNKSINIIEILDEYYILAIGKNEINFIEKISKEKIDKIKENKESFGFKEIFKETINKSIKYKK